MNLGNHIMKSWALRAGMMAAAMGAALAAPGAASAETRSYVMSYFGAAASSTDGDCVGGLNPKLDQQYAKDLRDLGYSGPQIEDMMRGFSGEGGAWDKDEVGRLMNSRARVNGEAANAYAHPAAVADPHLKYVTGKYAYGFNLSGLGAGDPNGFEDPETHEKGIDNQMFRALGCIDPYRGTLEHGTAFWLFMWMAEKDSSPAWLITLTGDDLSKDGPVTIKLSRALEVPKFNANGEARADMTYREDPNPHTEHNVFEGEIKSGTVYVTQHTTLHMMQDQLTFPNFDLNKFHMRLALKGDGTAEGFLAGYQPIEEIYFALGQGGFAAENNFSPELPGMYHLLRRLADGDPDPKTGVRWDISTTYHIKAAEAFVVPESRAKNAAAGQ